MAKDVDLSSKEWLDIVFDGKNKEFGAYKMRSESTGRHTKAVIIVVAALAVILAILMLAISGVFERSEEEGADASVDQQAVVTYNPEEQIEEEEIEEIPIPEEVIEMPKEEVANQIQNTIIDIVEDEKVVNEVKTQDELREDDRMIGGQDISDGVDDFTKQVVTQDVIVVETPKVEVEETYDMANVQQKPEFPGGESALYKWLGDHMQYPAQASEDGVQGRVVVQFVVAKDGSIQDVKVVRGRHPALDKEAIRVVKSMPKWNPGRNNGQAVKVTYTLPVQFKLQQ